MVYIVASVAVVFFIAALMYFNVSGDEVKRWFPAKIGNNEYIGDSAEYWWE